MFLRRLVRGYFNRVYNPLYDAGTGRLIRYRRAQERVAALLQAEPGNTVLCVGMGTGNEMSTLRTITPDLHLVGVDFSPNALVQARHKAAPIAETSFLLMEAEQLGFRDATFDRVLAYHLTDFLPSPEIATEEMLRVLKPNGRFAISFPSRAEGIGLGVSLFRSGFTDGVGKANNTTPRLPISAMLAGFAYLPLLLRPRPRTLSREELDRLLLPLGVQHYSVEHDSVYRDHIVSGIK